MEGRFSPGLKFTEELVLDAALVSRFAQFSGDHNAVHLDSAVARDYGFARPVAHGAIQTALVSKLIGMRVPGEGAVWMKQAMEWLQPAYVGDRIKIEIEITSISEGTGVLDLKLSATNQQGQGLMTGSARVKQACRVASATLAAENTAPKTALVTGGSRGIGAAIAEALATSGYRVAITYHSRKADADAVVERITSARGDAAAFQWDGQQEGSVADLIRAVNERLGTIHTLVHAGTIKLDATALDATTTSAIRAQLRAHAESATELAFAVAPSMKAAGFGRMIFLGTSYLFGQPPVKMLPYVVAKSAAWGLVRALATELGPDKITVNMISPSMTITELSENVPQRIKEAEARRTPLRRLAMPDDTATLAAFLASPASAFITGQNLPVTGGPV